MKTEVINIHPEFPEMDKLSYCAKVIRQGGLVIFPTETVYGIAADYNNAKAMARLREVKKRPAEKKFSIHVSQRELLPNYTPMTDPIVYKLIDAYWPGPLTIIVPSFEADKTIGVRMPQNLIAIGLVEMSQCTVAAPSANLSNQPPHSTCQEALAQLDGQVDVAIDGGAARYKQSSSVVDFMQASPTVVREGAISQDDVDRVVRRKNVLFVCTGNSCRSVMAEYLFRKMLKDSGHKEVDVISAGTGVFIRSRASSDTVNLLRKDGIDATGHEARPVNNVLLHKADLIFVMTAAHRKQVIEHVPSVEKRVYLLREFAAQSAVSQTMADIPDPIGRSSTAYEECYAIIKGSLKKVVEFV